MLLDVEGHGREELIAGVDVTRTVGWFTTLYPVMLDVGDGSTPGESGFDRIRDLQARHHQVFRHAAHWQPYIDSGQMVVFGPVLIDEGSFGLAVVEGEEEEELRAFAASDPVFTTGTASFEVGRMPRGFRRSLSERTTAGSRRSIPCDSACTTT